MGPMGMTVVTSKRCRTPKVKGFGLAYRADGLTAAGTGEFLRVGETNEFSTHGKGIGVLWVLAWGSCIATLW
jgi:hypothetical protein